MQFAGKPKGEQTNVYKRSLFSIFREIPNLPEREDGEGEESASYNIWNQPRKCVNTDTYTCVPDLLIQFCTRIKCHKV